MHRGASIIKPHLESLIVDGVQALEKDPSRLIQLSGQMIDFKLNGLSKLFQDAEKSVGQTSNWLQEIHHLVILSYHALLGLDRFESLSEGQKIDLITFLGVNIKKSLLTEEGKVTSNKTWYLAGVVEERTDRLLDRRMYFVDINGKVATQIEFFFGRPKTKALRPAHFFEAEMFFYPGTVSYRSLVQGLKHSHRSFDLHKNGPFNLKDLSEAIRQGLSSNPWLSRMAFWLNHVRFFRINEEYHLSDKHGSSLGVIVSDLWFDRLVLAGYESEISVLVEWRHGEIFVLSAYCYQQLFLTE